MTPRAPHDDPPAGRRIEPPAGGTAEDGPGGQAGDADGGPIAHALRSRLSPPAPPLPTPFRASAAGSAPSTAPRPYPSGDASGAGAPSLGRSLALDDGDLVLDARSHDLALVVGADALGQALELSVSTQTGSDRLNTRFGFDRLAIGTYAHDLPTRRQFLTMELVRCLSADRRVTDVREVVFDDDPRYRELRPGLDEETHRKEVAAAHAARVHTVYALVDTVANTTVTLRARGTP
ncbi:hypothetical protein ACFCZ6_09495 [Streptomyces hydrogenans]|uniref:hypothetical protein n=1 Tax=Streptomyces hydrogenans TaxID=1873719 RepID=UPI0035DF277D